MSIDEFTFLCEDMKMFDKAYGVRDMLTAFIKVNIDDELYEQPEEENTPTELVYDEFAEMIARLFHEREWLPRTQKQRLSSLAMAFGNWLEADFVPRALEAVQRHKATGAKQKMLYA